MDLIMDGLLVAGALFAACYCWVLSRRVRALQDLDSGLGGAITGMTRALEDARRALEDAKTATREGRHDLKDLITRAEAASGQLRILLAASRDLPAATAAPAPAARRPSPPPPPPPIEETAPVAPSTEPAAEGPGPGEDAPLNAVQTLPDRAPPRSPDALPSPAAAEPATAIPIPKPRRVFPLETLRPRPAAARREPSGETDILAELSALATGAGS
jgi:hypothetical protein